MKIIRQYVTCLLIITLLLINVGCFSISASSKTISVTINTTEQIAANSSKCFDVTWNDSYFYKKSSVFQSELAFLSMALSAAAYTEHEATNVNAALQEAGFTGISSGNSYSTNSIDSIGYTVARKKLKGDDVLLAIILRGTSQLEWYGNFDIAKNTASAGTENVHYNFHTAEQAVFNTVKQYILENNFSKEHTKIWITGHSRGGAVGNLLAADMNNSDLVKQHNIFAYTFATPNTVKNPIAYNNIFNIINEGDFFTLVPLSTWGFQRHGVDISCQRLFEQAGLKEAIVNDSIAIPFQDYTNVNYSDYQYDIEGMNQMIDYVSEKIPDVANYYSMKMKFGTENITLYQYFNTIVDVLAGDDTQRNSAVRKLGKSVLGEDDYSKLSVMLFNITMNRSIYFAHMPENYLSWTKIMAQTNMKEDGSFRPVMLRAPGKNTVKVGEKAKFKVITLGGDSDVTWSVSDRKKATISKKGVLKGKKKGIVKVTAKAGKLKRTFKVKIKK